jgi:hypothetical protein
VAKLVDAQASGACGVQTLCRFESGSRHQIIVRSVNSHKKLQKVYFLSLSVKKPRRFFVSNVLYVAWRYKALVKGFFYV